MSLAATKISCAAALSLLLLLAACASPGSGGGGGQPPPPPYTPDPQWCVDIHMQETGLRPDPTQMSACLADFNETRNGDVARQRVVEREIPPLTRPDTAGPLGASYYTSLTDPDIVPRHFAYALSRYEVSFTRVWLLDAWAVYPNGPGQYAGRLPVTYIGGGRFDLFQWNEGYFGHLMTYTDEMNRFGIVPIYTILDLYSWSDRKQGMPFVPDASLGPFQSNINGVRWRDDSTFTRLPDFWLSQFMCKVVSTLGPERAYAFEIGNEMPEKEMHFRMARVLRDQCGFTGPILVNRNDDAPGQYVNMQIGRGLFDGISFHAMKTLEYLTDIYADEPQLKTFEQAFTSADVDMGRVMLSSDGARASLDVERAYDYVSLVMVAKDIIARGGRYEHQLAMKLRRFRDGYISLGDIQYDDWFLREVVR